MTFTMEHDKSVIKTVNNHEGACMGGGPTGGLTETTNLCSESTQAHVKLQNSALPPENEQNDENENDHKDDILENSPPDPVVYVRKDSLGAEKRSKHESRHYNGVGEVLLNSFEKQAVENDDISKDSEESSSEGETQFDASPSDSESEEDEEEREILRRASLEHLSRQENQQANKTPRRDTGGSSEKKIFGPEESASMSTPSSDAKKSVKRVVDSCPTPMTQATEDNTLDEDTSNEASLLETGDLRDDDDSDISLSQEDVNLAMNRERKSETKKPNGSNVQEDPQSSSLDVLRRCLDNGAVSSQLARTSELMSSLDNITPSPERKPSHERKFSLDDFTNSVGQISSLNGTSGGGDLSSVGKRDQTIGQDSSLSMLAGEKTMISSPPRSPERKINRPGPSDRASPFRSYDRSPAIGDYTPSPKRKSSLDHIISNASTPPQIPSESQSFVPIDSNRPNLAALEKMKQGKLVGNADVKKKLTELAYGPNKTTNVASEYRPLGDDEEIDSESEDESDEDSDEEEANLVSGSSSDEENSAASETPFRNPRSSMSSVQSILESKFDPTTGTPLMPQKTRRSVQPSMEEMLKSLPKDETRSMDNANDEDALDARSVRDYGAALLALADSSRATRRQRKFSPPTMMHGEKADDMPSESAPSQQRRDMTQSPPMRRRSPIPPPQDGHDRTSVNSNLNALSKPSPNNSNQAWSTGPSRPRVERRGSASSRSSVSSRNSSRRRSSAPESVLGAQLALFKEMSLEDDDALDDPIQPASICQPGGSSRGRDRNFQNGGSRRKETNQMGLREKKNALAAGSVSMRNFTTSSNRQSGSSYRRSSLRNLAAGCETSVSDVLQEESGSPAPVAPTRKATRTSSQSSTQKLLRRAPSQSTMKATENTSMQKRHAQQQPRQAQLAQPSRGQPQHPLSTPRGERPRPVRRLSAPFLLSGLTGCPSRKEDDEDGKAVLENRHASVSELPTFDDAVSVGSNKSNRFIENAKSWWSRRRKPEQGGRQESGGRLMMSRQSSRNIGQPGRSPVRKEVRIKPEPTSDVNPHTVPYILGSAVVSELASHHLPPHALRNEWRRLYSLARDGDSFDMFLRSVAQEPRSLLVVRTTREDVFGGFVDSPWEAASQDVGFFGSTKSFLFKVVSKEMSQTSLGSTSTGSQSSGPSIKKQSERDKLVVFKTTGKNRYIQLIDTHSKMIAMGGGGGSGTFGLCLQDDFNRGSSGPSETYGNAPLSRVGQFDVLDFEVWGF